MPKRCPVCEYNRSWQLRRNKRKCKRCRHEFSRQPYLPICGIRATEKAWRACILIFLRERTIKRIAEETNLGHCQVEKMVRHLRRAMLEHLPPPFTGVTEVDETYIGGQRKNKKLHIRRLSPPKRGHGTDKLPIFGLFNRNSGRVHLTVLVKEARVRRRDRKQKREIFNIIKERVAAGSTVYTDSFALYDRLSEFHPCRHESVNHYQGEYSRGEVHTNNIEGFWGILKRKMGCVGGMRRKNLPYFAAEIVWKFNHRKHSLNDQVTILLNRIIR